MLGRIVATELGHQLVFTRDLAVPAARVWQMLTDREARATWLFEGSIEPYVGGVVDLFDSHHHVTGRVTAWDPPHLLALTWSSPDAPLGEVRFEVTPTATTACRLRVVHTAEGQARPRSLAAGWHAMLDRLLRDLGLPSAGGAPSFDDLLRVYDDVSVEGPDEA